MNINDLPRYRFYELLEVCERLNYDKTATSKHCNDLHEKLSEINVSDDHLKKWVCEETESKTNNEFRMKIAKKVLQNIQKLSR